MAYPDTPNIHWRRISPALALRTLAESVLSLLVLIGITVALSLIPHEFPWWLIGLALVIITAVQIPFGFLRVRAIGYALRQDDIVFTRGIIVKQLRAVPYGRLQAVDVNRTLFDRMLGIATLSTVTAAGPGVSIPGLTVREADELRDHLIRVAETRRAGL